MHPLLQSLSFEMQSLMSNLEAAQAQNDPTPAELALFCVVSYGIRLRPPDLPELATCDFYGVAGPTTTEEFKEALDSCIDKGWLQIIDAASLKKITEEINREQLLGPVYGLPAVGTVDFTSTGADLWLNRNTNEHRRSFAYTDVVHKRISRYYRDKDLAQSDVAETTALANPRRSVSGPIAIGPWRAQWWRRYNEGFRVDIEEKFQWTGLCSSGTGWYMSREPDNQTILNPERLLHILERLNVKPGEWMILAMLDNSEPYFPEALVRFSARGSKKRFELVISEEDCRSGLEACIQQGWIRLVDETVRSELQSFLKNAPEEKPLYERDTIASTALDTVDYTVDGASLYQKIADEYFGINWDHRINVEHEVYRKEHRYCLTEAPIIQELAEYKSNGENVLSHTMVPIGPWCVYWWDRYPGGLMLEVEIGTK